MDTISITKKVPVIKYNHNYLVFTKQTKDICSLTDILILTDPLRIRSGSDSDFILTRHI